MMKFKARINYWSNPAIGLLPFLIYSISMSHFSYLWSLVIALSFGLFFLVNTRGFLRKHVFPMFIMASVVCFGLTLIVGGLFLPKEYEDADLLLPELILFVILNLFLVNKRRLLRAALLFGPARLGFSLKSYLYECFFLLGFLYSFLILYLVIGGGYLYLFPSFHTPELHSLILCKFRIFLIAILMVTSHIRLYLLNSRFQRESWLPIIDERSRVVGRIARSVSYQFKEKYLHPRVRILLFHKGMLFLTPRGAYQIVDVGKLDTPFHKDLLCDQSEEDLIQNLLTQNGLPSNLKPNFFTQYTYENFQLRRVISLYTLQLDLKYIEHNPNLRKGKLWTEQQIFDNLGKEVFSDCFENEFEFLKETIFPAFKMMNEVEI